MLSAEESLNFIRERIDALGHGSKHHERAAHDALTLLSKHWSEESGESMDNDLAVIEMIGQDLADLQRHIADLQHAYLKALFGDKPD
ncbi:hypothetical protein P7L74_18825 [Tistrella mobilis]|jgi:hypothetical protein|uniref:hypothetical protein n=1 Tax=Tistrella mobilis TaxID=171437 RepID=UPI003558521B